MADLKAIATQIRRDIVRMVHGASSGHPGGSLGCADYFAALYFKVLKHDPAFNMDGKNEDLFSCRTDIFPPYSTPHSPGPVISISRNWPLSARSIPGFRDTPPPTNIFPVSASPAAPSDKA